MQDILAGLFFKSIVMTCIGLLFIAVTPFLFKRYSARWLYYSWPVILLGFVFPFTFNMPAPVINLSEPASLPANEAVPAKSSEVTLISSSIDTISSLSVWQLTAVIWIAGTIIFLAVHLARHNRFMSTVNRWGKVITEPAILHLLEKVKEEMNITKEIALKESGCISSPMLAGFSKNTIWLPANSYSEEELHIILKHELVHLKRKDLWYKAFVLAVSSIHWFNPLLYRFGKEIDNLCEYACDEEVIKNTGMQVRKTYSQTILHAEKCKREKGMLSTNFLGSTQTFKNRIFSIMDMSKKKSGIAVLVLVTLLTTGGLTVSSAFAVSSTPISYIDETFMKESILHGASRGNFATDYLIHYPKAVTDKKDVPEEPPLDGERYQNSFSAGVIGTEARYRYPVEIVHKQYGEKYTTVIYIDYDYKLLAPIEYDELNSLIESYLLPFNELSSVPFEDFTRQNYVENKLKNYIQAIDQQNVDERVEFEFHFSGLATNNNYLPLLNEYPIGTAPRYMKSAR